MNVLDLAQIKDLRFRKVDSKIPGTLSVHTKKSALLHGAAVSIAWSIARAIGAPVPEETVHFMPKYETDVATKDDSFWKSGQDGSS